MESKRILTEFALFTLFTLVANLLSDLPEHKTVDTKSGRIRGIKELTFFGNKPFYSYRGIPYAEKPIGSLRFKVNTPFCKVIEFHFDFCIIIYFFHEGTGADWSMERYI